MNKKGMIESLCFKCKKVRKCPVGEQVITVKGEIVVTKCKYMNAK